MITQDKWAAYPAWRPQIAEAIDEAFYPMPWLDERVWTGSAMVDTAPGAIVLTEWKRYPSGLLTIEGLVGAGDLDVIITTIRPVLEQRGRDVGAAYLQMDSRPGWARALRAEGYEQHQLTIRKALA